MNTLMNIDPWGFLDDLFDTGSRALRTMRARAAGRFPPVNVYLDMGAGVELFERWQLRAGYNFSVGQTFHTKLLDENVAKNRTWYVNLTWFLK